MSKTSSSTDHVLNIDIGGVVSGLHTEAIPLPALGKIKSIVRVSEIEWSQVHQKWEVWLLAELRVAFRHESREECLRWERAYFNDKPESSSPKT